MHNSVESEKLLESLFDRKILLIMRFFLNRRGQQFTLKEISKSTKVPLASTYRILIKLLELDILSKNKIKHLKLYTLNQNDKTTYLDSLLEKKKTIIDEFVEAVSKLDGLKEILLYGKEEKDKANVLVIGEGIKPESVREVIVNIKQKYNFTMTHLLLTEDQYTQMAAMNLYPGKKQLLFQKIDL
jgi:hypothetical protein